MVLAVLGVAQQRELAAGHGTLPDVIFAVIRALELRLTLGLGPVAAPRLARRLGVIGLGHLLEHLDAAELGGHGPVAVVHLRESRRQIRRHLLLGEFHRRLGRRLGRHLLLELRGEGGEVEVGTILRAGVAAVVRLPLRELLRGDLGGALLAGRASGDLRAARSWVERLVHLALESVHEALHERARGDDGGAAARRAAATGRAGRGAGRASRTGCERACDARDGAVRR